MREAWRGAWRKTGFRWQFWASLGLLVLILALFTRFLEWVEARPGVVLPDPVLRFIAPLDFTWLTFGVIYLAVVLAVFHLAGKPLHLLLAIQAYTLLVVVRTVMMFLVPLEPAAGLLVLRDPLVQFVGNSAAPTKDLFFSGHTSTMFLLALVMTERKYKNIYLLFTFLVAVCVIWQHVHYVIDVVVAPFVAYACYRMALSVQQRSLAHHP